MAFNGKSLNVEDQGGKRNKLKFVESQSDFRKLKSKKIWCDLYVMRKKNADLNFLIKKIANDKNI